MQIFLEIYFNFTLIYCVFQYIYIKKRLFLDINLTIDVSFKNYILLLQFTSFFHIFFTKLNLVHFCPYISAFFCALSFLSFVFSFNFATIFHFTFICFFICIYLSLFYVHLLLFIRLKYFSLLIIVFLKNIHCYKLNKKTLILFIIFH